MAILSFPQAPYLGQLEQALVGTSGQGLAPGWHIDRMEVIHTPTGNTWAFRWVRPQAAGPAHSRPQPTPGPLPPSPRRNLCSAAVPPGVALLQVQRVD